jgi:hypothetical protein
MKNQRMTRRTMLKGIGTVAIGLPFLEEMFTSSTLAAPAPAVPARAFNLFFGLGIPAPLQQEGYDGVLEPLSALKDKLLILREVDQTRCDEPGINAHYDGSSGAFTAEPPNGTARAGGPSIDQVIRRAHYPNGFPSGVVPTLQAGTFFRRNDRLSRYVQSFADDGTPAGTMIEKPRDLFERVFGTFGTDGSVDAQRQRLKRSVLDSVVDQYKFYTGANSPLGTASKARLDDHLDRIREFELRAYSLEARAPGAPQIPPRSKLVHGGEADPGGEGIDITLEELIEGWRLMADLYATAIQMDKARIGSLTFLAAGERIRLKGDYSYNGRKVFHFDDAAQHKASGAAGCSHEWWHKFDESKPNEALRAHVHMKMRELAYFLGRLDAANMTEANGRTVLENSLITISTESGDGRHSDSKRELSGVFHAITGANGRFKSGQILDVGAEGIDLYNTMLSAMGATRRLGPATREHRAVDSIRA